MSGGNDSQLRYVGLVGRELVLALAIAALVLVINKAVIDDRGSSWLVVLMVGFWLGVVVVDGLRALLRLVVSLR